MTNKPLTKNYKYSICIDCYEYQHGFEPDNNAPERCADNRKSGFESIIGDSYVSENEEAYFSWCRCDMCDSDLGGDRYDVIMPTIVSKNSLSNEEFGRSQLEYETVKLVVSSIMCNSSSWDWNWCNHCYGVCPVELPTPPIDLYHSDPKAWNRMYSALTKDLTAKAKQWSDDKLITHARAVSDSISYIDVDRYESMMWSGFICRDSPYHQSVDED